MLIHLRLAQIAKLIKPVPKLGTNKPDGYKFRGIYELYNELGPLFADAGVSVQTEVLSRVESIVDTNKGKCFKVVVHCKFKLVAEDASFVELISYGEAIDASDKATNKAITSAIKYALTYLFLIPVANFEDADSQTVTIKPFAEEQHTLKELPKGILALAESKGLSRKDLLRIGQSLGLPVDEVLTAEQKKKLYYFVKDNEKFD